jgi:hypothetical protein
MASSKSATVLVLLCACGDSGGATGVTTTGVTSVSATDPSAGPTAGDDPGAGTTAGDATGGSAPTTGGDDTSTGGLKLDIPDGETATGGVPGEGCAKVDFLFVLDNSISMGDEQQNLAASFPGFISTIQSQVEAQDYHIMVIDTDDQDKWGEKYDKCFDKCMTDDPGDHCLTVYFDDLICGELPPPPPACDQTLGAGRSQGAGGPPVACPIDDGLRYMTQAQADLGGTFQCVAEMGATGNSNERPVDAMLQALGPQTAADGCHPGFSRPDSVLVVTMISDEQENGSGGTPAGWYQDLLALKGGNTTAVVLLSLNGDAETMGQECVPTAKMEEFVGLFGERGVIGSICEPDYGPFFQEAVGIIDAACDQFVPPG